MRFISPFRRRKTWGRSLETIWGSASRRKNAPFGSDFKKAWHRASNIIEVNLRILACMIVCVCESRLLGFKTNASLRYQKLVCMRCVPCLLNANEPWATARDMFYCFRFSCRSEAPGNGLAIFCSCIHAVFTTSFPTGLECRVWKVRSEHQSPD